MSRRPPPLTQSSLIESRPLRVSACSDSGDDQSEKSNASVTLSDIREKYYSPFLSESHSEGESLLLIRRRARLAEGSLVDVVDSLVSHDDALSGLSSIVAKEMPAANDHSLRNPHILIRSKFSDSPETTCGLSVKDIETKTCISFFPRSIWPKEFYSTAAFNLFAVLKLDFKSFIYCMPSSVTVNSAMVGIMEATTLANASSYRQRIMNRRSVVLAIRIIGIAPLIAIAWSSKISHSLAAACLMEILNKAINPCISLILSAGGDVFRVLYGGCGGNCTILATFPITDDYSDSVTAIYAYETATLCASCIQSNDLVEDRNPLFPLILRRPDLFSIIRNDNGVTSVRLFTAVCGISVGDVFWNHFGGSGKDPASNCPRWEIVPFGRCITEVIEAVGLFSFPSCNDNLSIDAIFGDPDSSEVFISDDSDSLGDTHAAPDRVQFFNNSDESDGGECRDGGHEIVCESTHPVVFHSSERDLVAVCVIAATSEVADILKPFCNTKRTTKFSAPISHIYQSLLGSLLQFTNDQTTYQQIVSVSKKLIGESGTVFQFIQSLMCDVEKLLPKSTVTNDDLPPPSSLHLPRRRLPVADSISEESIKYCVSACAGIGLSALSQAVIQEGRRTSGVYAADFDGIGLGGVSLVSLSGTQFCRDLRDTVHASNDKSPVTTFVSIPSLLISVDGLSLNPVDVRILESLSSSSNSHRIFHRRRGAIRVPVSEIADEKSGLSESEDIHRRLQFIEEIDESRGMAASMIKKIQRVVQSFGGSIVQIQYHSPMPEVIHPMDNPRSDASGKRHGRRGMKNQRGSKSKSFTGIIPQCSSVLLHCVFGLQVSGVDVRDPLEVEVNACHAAISTAQSLSTLASSNKLYDADAFHIKRRSALVINMCISSGPSLVTIAGSLLRREFTVVGVAPTLAYNVLVYMRSENAVKLAAPAESIHVSAVCDTSVVAVLKSVDISRIDFVPISMDVKLLFLLNISLLHYNNKDLLVKVDNGYGGHKNLKDTPLFGNVKAGNVDINMDENKTKDFSLYKIVFIEVTISDAGGGAASANTSFISRMLRGGCGFAPSGAISENHGDTKTLVKLSTSILSFIKNSDYDKTNIDNNNRINSTIYSESESESDPPESVAVIVCGSVSSHSNRNTNNEELLKKVFIIGRQRERDMISLGFRLLSQNRGFVLYIEADIGVGKTRVMDYVLTSAICNNVPYLYGNGSHIERWRPFVGWKSILSSVFKLSEIGVVSSQSTDYPNLDDNELLGDYKSLYTTDICHREFLRILNSPFDNEMNSNLTADERNLKVSDYEMLFPLLADILPIAVTDNGITKQFDVEDRAHMTLILLLRIFASYFYGNGATVVVMEDAHWMDSQSWSLLHSLICNLPCVFVVIASRPIEHPPQGCVRIRMMADVEGAAEKNGSYRHPTVVFNKMGPLDDNDTKAMIISIANCKSVSQQVFEIFNNAAGNPFYVEELAATIISDGLTIISKQGELQFCPGVPMFYLPSSVNKMVASRVNSLPSGLQTMLRVAAIVGTSFFLRLVHDIFPDQVSMSDLSNCVKAGIRAGILVGDTTNKSFIIFKHAITHSVIYCMNSNHATLLLHKKVARWYEKQALCRNEVSTSYECQTNFIVLAYHWNSARNFEKAYYYYSKAGIQALSSNNNFEAVVLLSFALLAQSKIVKRSPKEETSAATCRESVWYHYIAMALYRAGHYRECDFFNQLSFVSMKERLVPCRGAGLDVMISVLIELLRQIGYRLFPKVMEHVASTDPVNSIVLKNSPSITTSNTNLDRKSYLQVSRFYFDTGETHYFMGDLERSMYDSLRSLNLAEAAGGPPSNELGQGFAFMCLLGGLVGLSFVADWYAMRCFAVQVTTDPTSKVWQLLTVGVYFATHGHWQKAEAVVDRVLVMTSKLGMTHRYELGTCLKGYFAAIQGRCLLSMRCYSVALSSSIVRKDAHYQIIWSCGRIQSSIAAGKFSEAEETLKTIEAMIGGCDNRIMVCWYRASKAFLLYFSKPRRLLEGLSVALSAFDIFSTRTFSVFYAHFSIDLILAILLDALENALVDENEWIDCLLESESLAVDTLPFSYEATVATYGYSALRARCRYACLRFLFFGVAFPISICRAQNYCGQFLAITGHSTLASVTLWFASRNAKRYRLFADESLNMYIRVCYIPSSVSRMALVNRLKLAASVAKDLNQMVLFQKIDDEIYRCRSHKRLHRVLKYHSEIWTLWNLWITIGRICCLFLLLQVMTTIVRWNSRSLPIFVV